MATTTVVPKKSITLSCPQQEWVIHNLSALKENILLPKFVVEGVSWCVKLEATSNEEIPGIFLHRLTRMTRSMNVKFAIKLVDRQDATESIDCEFEASFTDVTPSWGWDVPVKTKPTPPGLIMDDQLVLQTHLWIMKDLNPGSFDELLLEDSRDFLAQACLRIYTGKNAPQPDVMLKVEDDKLPAHRTLLAESSDVFEAMFQSGMSKSRSKVVEIQEVAAEDMKIILKYIYGVLNALPEERLHHLILAAYRFQMARLMEHCISRVKARLCLDTFAETAMTADRVSNRGLHEACVQFALQEKNRSALREHGGLKQIIVDAPDLAFRLIGDVLKRSVTQVTEED